ncbi:MAG: hypothetical protein NUV74_17165 [Candidatus Brocadiaceae bacterium]|nr:hypothetical protein [Candidatus Brocadiaceae bacterium]
MPGEIVAVWLDNHDHPSPRVAIEVLNTGKVEENNQELSNLQISITKYGRKY